MCLQYALDQLESAADVKIMFKDGKRILKIRNSQKIFEFEFGFAVLDIGIAVLLAAFISLHNHDALMCHSIQHLAAAHVVW